MFCLFISFFSCYAYFWATIQRVPGQDELLGNRVSFNSQDVMNECQNQPIVTCCSSWVSLGKAKPEGGRKLFTIRLLCMCVCVCMCEQACISLRVEQDFFFHLNVNICMKGGVEKNKHFKFSLISTDEKFV